MGKDTRAEVVWPGGERDAGRLQLELPRLSFRGQARRVWQGADLAGIRADGHQLILADGTRLTLPGMAKGWVDEIVTPKGRLDKLGVKAGQKVAIINLPDPKFLTELSARVTPVSATGNLDILFYGADSAEELAAIGALVPRLAERGALWVVSLKGRAAKLKDTEVMAAAEAHGLVDNKVCAFSDARTALRFTRRLEPRPPRSAGPLPAGAKRSGGFAPDRGRGRSSGRSPR